MCISKKFKQLILSDLYYLIRKKNIFLHILFKLPLTLQPIEKSKEAPFKSPNIQNQLSVVMKTF